MKVTTKSGDKGCSCLPTIKDTLVSKGSIAFEVLGKIDQLDHDLQSARLMFTKSNFVVFNQLASNLEHFLVQGVRGLYRCMLCTETTVDFTPEFGKYVEELESSAKLFEELYLFCTGRVMESDFGKIYNTVEALSLDRARVHCRDLERCLVQQYDQQVKDSDVKKLYNHEAIIPFVNRLSDWLYEAALMVDSLEASK